MSLLTCQLLVCMGAAHVFGDCCLRSDRAQSRQRLRGALQRAATIAVLSYVLCGAWKSWLTPCGVLIVYTLIDTAMARMSRRNAVSHLLNEAAHAIALVVIAVAAARQGPSLYGVELFGAEYLKVLILLAGAVLTVFSGGVLIGLAVDPLLTELRESREGLPLTDRGFKQGGKYIGWLERTLTFVFVLSGEPTSIGFLIAAKSIFRFGELKDHRRRMEAEYIIIGTMMSIGFGLLIAYCTKFLLELRWA